MRLLRLRGPGDFSLVDFHRDIPPYAILSHTWGADSEEITFKDMAEGTGKNKAGYKKLCFCARQAAADKLQYFWVDTCCIDKSSSAELSESIRSMFRWYQNAAVCYAFLVDVSTDGQSFEKSRWFTRGWTLQELIAPKSVEFFNAKGKLLGDKVTLLPKILKATQVPAQALQGYPISFFDVHERIEWAKGRDTKREEDMVYSLLGLCDVHIPPDYGEGRKTAFRRLQEEIRKVTADQPPNDALFRFVRNRWSRQLPKQDECLLMPISEEEWHNRQNHIHRVAGILRGLLATVLFVWLIVSVSMLQYTPSVVWSVSWLVGNMCGCVYGMQLLFKEKWNRFVTAGWAHFAAACWVYLVALTLALLGPRWSQRERSSRFNGNTRLNNDFS